MILSNLNLNQTWIKNPGSNRCLNLLFQTIAVSKGVIIGDHDTLGNDINKFNVLTKKGKNLASLGEADL